MFLAIDLNLFHSDIFLQQIKSSNISHCVKNLKFLLEFLEIDKTSLTIILVPFCLKLQFVGVGLFQDVRSVDLLLAYGGEFKLEPTSVVYR